MRSGKTGDARQTHSEALGRATHWNARLQLLLKLTPATALRPGLMVTIAHD
jgi:hypothetical protein